MKKSLLALIGAIAFAVAGFAAIPGSATITPVYSITYSTIFGPPTGDHLVSGTITLGSTDTYVIGGFSVSPANIGCLNSIDHLMLGSSGMNYNTFTANAAAPAAAGGSWTVTLLQALNGAGKMAAGATATAVPLPSVSGAVIASTSPIYAQLNDAAVPSTGTWSTTESVVKVVQATSTSFTLTVTPSVAPSNGGGFVWYVPSIQVEVNSGGSVASAVIPFVALCK